MNWKLLLAIADLAGGDWPKAARQAAVKFARERREPSQGKRLLSALWDMFKLHGSIIATAKVQELLTADPNSEWANYSQGPISQWQIAKLFDPHDIHPRFVRPSGGKPERSYVEEDFATAFSHHLGKPPPNNRYTATPRSKQRSKP
jgi:Protein of unknown function (DUF3631)